MKQSAGFPNGRYFALALALTFCLFPSISAEAGPLPTPPSGKPAPAGLVTPEDFVCGTRPAAEFMKQFQEAVNAGEIPNPAMKALPQVDSRVRTGRETIGTLTAADLMLYPDAAGVLAGSFSSAALFNLMTQAANALIAEHGDQFDYIAFWLNFGVDPGSQIGSAFYLGLENDIAGIGEGFYNSRPGMGLAGTNTEGYVMMWNVNGWLPGTFQNADFTRLVLGQEFEHRFAMFLSPIVGGRDLQGDDASCGRSAHWSWRVDGQGSGMEIQDWQGANPAQRFSGSITFNTDIVGGVFSYSDLYLMGYVSGAEMDAGNSELRFIDNSCTSPYNGPIFNFSSTEIIASNGDRIPSSANAQKNYKTGWIMIYRPASPPTQANIDRALGIMQQHQTDWNLSTVGRGTMDASIASGNFTGTPLMAEGANTVQFTYDTTFAASAWKWKFGDGDSSALENPSHNYRPGLYDVTLYVTTPHDVRTTLKQDYITFWADTLSTRDTSVVENAGAFYWEVRGTNMVPLKELSLPITMTNVPAALVLDSISAVGCRTNYFEYKQISFSDPAHGKMAIRLRANNGGGAPPLPPGTGPIARIYVHTAAGAQSGQVVNISVGPLGSQTYLATTVTTTFLPVFNAGKITITAPPCDCSCHADPQCDGVTNIVDVINVVNEAFRGAVPVLDPGCPDASRNDTNCDCQTDILDVVNMVEVAFRAGNPATKFCNSCVFKCR